MRRAYLLATKSSNANFTHTNMEPFKSLKNYLLTSASPAAPSPPSDCNNKVLANIENQHSPALSRSSSDEEKARFSLFRKGSTKQAKQRDSGKFLRTKSSGSDSDSLKSARLKEASPKKQPVDGTSDDGRELFHLLACNLTELIEHFSAGQMSAESPIFEKANQDKGKFKMAHRNGRLF